MADDRIEPSEQIPEADFLEQQAALDPALTHSEPSWPGLETAIGPVDEADRWEQQQPVPEADEDYPPGSVEAG